MQLSNWNACVLSSVMMSSFRLRVSRTSLKIIFPDRHLQWISCKTKWKILCKTLSVLPLKHKNSLSRCELFVVFYEPILSRTFFFFLVAQLSRCELIWLDLEVGELPKINSWNRELIFTIFDFLQLNFQDQTDFTLGLKSNLVDNPSNPLQTQSISE